MAKLLDLFCGGGGASMGYHQAGYELIGVDIKHRAEYPFEQITRDAMGIDWLKWQALKESIPPAYTKFIGDQIRNTDGNIRIHLH